MCERGRLRKVEKGGGVDLVYKVVQILILCLKYFCVSIFIYIYIYIYIYNAIMLFTAYVHSLHTR